jgi:1,3-beta-glucan synthase
MKQSKLRRRRVFRFAVLYFVMLIVFVGLIVGPVVGGKSVGKSLTDMVPSSLNLLQPTDLDNDDTRGDTPTGTGRDGYTGAFTPTAATTAVTSAQTSSSNNNKIKLV